MGATNSEKRPHPTPAPTSELHIVKCVLQALRSLYGSTNAADFGPNALRALRQKWIDAGLSRRTVNHYVTLTKHLFKWAASHEMVPGSVHHALITLSGLRAGRSEARETEPIRPVSEEHIEAIRPHVSAQVWALIQLQLLTAARPGELLNLRPRDIDTAGAIWSAALADHKTAYHGRPRVIYFGPRAQSVLRPWLLRAPDAYLFSPKEALATIRYAGAMKMHRRPDQKPSPRMTARTLGDCYTVNSYRRAITRACQDAGVPPWHPHQLRHTAATRIRKEHGLEAAQVFLGHASADVTQMYAEVNHIKAVEIAAQVG